MPAGRLSRSTWALAALCFISLGVMCAIAFNYFLAGKWYLADVGNIQYCLVNTWQGDFMWSPLAMANHFALHFTPFLLLLTPVIWLSPYAIPLVMLYQAALALTPVPIYMMARQRGLPGSVAVAAGFWFVCNHFLGSLQLANHFENFYVLFALCAMAALYRENRYAWWIFAALALSVKEDAAVWMLGFALWALIFESNPLARRRAWPLAGLCLCWGAVAASIMTYCAQGQVMDATSFFKRMNGFSIGLDNLWVFLMLIASCGVLCLLDWRAALLLLIPTPVILGNFHITRYLIYYYSYPFLPFMAFATVAGLARLWGWLASRWQRRPTAEVDQVVNAEPESSPYTQETPHGAAAWGVVLFLVVLGAIQYPLATRTDGYKRFFVSVTPRDNMRRHIASDILPRQAPVALQFDLWGVVPWRPDVVFLNPVQLQDHHYVFLDLHGNLGLTPEGSQRVLIRLRDEVQSGKRRELYDAYDFLILSPVTGSATSEEAI